MDLVVIGFVAGVIGTLAMDLLNKLVARTGLFLKIDVAMIGRMAAGWTRGFFGWVTAVFIFTRGIVRRKSFSRSGSCGPWALKRSS